MASPRALDVFSTPVCAAPRGSSSDEEDRATTALKELLYQREEDVLTREMMESEQARRDVADEELREAKFAADEKIAMMENAISQCMNSSGPTRPPASSQEGGIKAGSSASHQNRSGVPCSPAPVPSTPEFGSMHSSRQLQTGRVVDPALKRNHLGGIASVPPLFQRRTRYNDYKGDEAAEEFAMLSPSPATESLAHQLPSIPRLTSTTPSRGAAMPASWRGSPFGPPRAATTSRGPLPPRQSSTETLCTSRQSDQRHRQVSPSAGGAQSARERGSEGGAGRVPPAASGDGRWLPQSFLSSHFQSIVKWAEMSFEEARVAQGASAYVAPSAAMCCCADGGEDDAKPSGLLTTTAYCAIIDEVLWNLPGFRHIWEQMRGEIFSSIFRLKKADLACSLSAPSALCPDKHGAASDNTSSGGGQIGRMTWFSRVCGRRDTWFDTASIHLEKSRDLQEKLSNINVSLEKYDLIFDIYGRTADRQVQERAFRAWRTTASRNQERNAGLLQVFSRIHKRSPVLVAFHGWRRLVFQRKLRSSKDKDATLSAVHEARLKSKAAELDCLQRQLEAETQRLRGNAERDSRKHAALLTSHAVEMRELQSCQEEKDAVILSLEKIAKRWERLAKTYRPLLFRAPLPQNVLHVARGLHDAETEIAAKGPSPARLARCREALDKVLCVWVNTVLDKIGSKSMRIKNTTTDVREGEALMALCRYLISRSTTTDSESLAQPKPPLRSSESPVTSSQVLSRQGSMSSIAAQLHQSSKESAMNQVQSLHSVVVKALYLGTAQGLAPLLVSTCPFGQKILGREEDFLAAPHPTAGAWILASLFVCELVQTFSQISSPTDVRFGCPAEAHVASQSPEFALMLSSDRTASTSATTYVPQKREVAKETLKQAPLYQDNHRSGKLFLASATKSSSRGSRSGSASCAPQQQGGTTSIHDTPSDIDAYLGKDEEGSDVGGGGGGGGDLSSHDYDRRRRSTHEVGDVIEGAESEDESLSRGSTTVDSDVDDPMCVESKTFDRIGGGSNHPLRANSAAAAAIAFGNKLQRQISQPFSSFTDFVSPPATPPPDGSSSPSTSVHHQNYSAGAGYTFQDGRASDGVTSPVPPPSAGGGRRAISPVRTDLQDLAMHTLFRKLRRETRQREDWVGLARLVTSVVLRYRILDVDAPVKGRVSVVSAPFTESDAAPAVVVAPDLPSRSPSFLQKVPTLQLHRQPQPNAPPQSSAVPRASATNSLPGRHAPNRQPPGVISRGGSMFFSQDAAEVTPAQTTSSSGKVVQPGTSGSQPPFSPSLAQTSESTPSSTGGRRSTAIKFE